MQYFVTIPSIRDEGIFLDFLVQQQNNFTAFYQALNMRDDKNNWDNK
jgi:hypothetical protein